MQQNSKEAPAIVQYKGKNFPVFNREQFSFKYGKKSWRIILTTSGKITSKDITKLKHFKYGFVLIKKKKKPLGAVSCLDLAILCNAYKWHKTPSQIKENMLSKIAEFDQKESTWLREYLTGNGLSFSALIGFMIYSKNILPYVNSTEIEQAFWNTQIIKGKAGGRDLIRFLYCIIFKRLTSDFDDSGNKQKMLPHLYRFSQQHGELVALNFEENWHKNGRQDYIRLTKLLSVIESTDNLDYVLLLMDAIDEFLGKKNEKISRYFYMNAKHSDFNLLPLDVRDVIARLILEK